MSQVVYLVNVIEILFNIFNILLYVFIAILVIKGILPVLYRLGIGLTRRKIAIFADTKFDSLKDLLVDSGLFNEKNIVKIDKESIKKAEDISLLLVHYKPFRDKIDEIISIKRDSDALIIYAPSEDGRIEENVLRKINSQRNTIVVNFRGRLLNDILVSMITTGYKM